MSFPIVPLKKVKKKLVFTAEEIEKKISTMSRKINDHYDNLMLDKPVLVIGILKSSVFFLTSLLKKLKFPLVVDFLQIDSYYGNFLKKKNMPVISSQTTFCPENHHVLIVEDVIESGKTLLHVKEFLNKKGVLSLNFAILIKKHVSRHVSVDLNDDFLGWHAFSLKTDDFLFGFGMDLLEQKRELKDIFSLNLKENDFLLKFQNHKN